jgi:pyruvate formate-lyase activating enzyme-like uncharacterized protein
MIETFPWGSLALGPISPGCRLCHAGRKLVVFVTGECHSSCYYCPISAERRGRDILLANERVILKEAEELVDEARISDSWGASFTGGDPGLVPDRVLRVAALLRKEFGSDYHMHVYVRPSEVLTQYFKTWANYIDEIRFHVRNKRELDLVAPALLHHWSVGLEVPVFPLKARNGVLWQRTRIILEEWVKLSRRFEVQPWANLNEIEVSETNAALLRAHDLEGDGYRILGCDEGAKALFDWVVEKDLPLFLHYCSARTKDGKQLPNRLLLRARNVALPFDIIQEDSGLLIRGVIRSKKGSQQSFESLLKLWRSLLVVVEKEDMELDPLKSQILVNPLILDEEENLEMLRQVVGPDYIIGFSEEYPTTSRLETSFAPL